MELKDISWMMIIESKKPSVFIALYLENSSEWISARLRIVYPDLNEI
jgi:hypothetical protein